MGELTALARFEIRHRWTDVVLYAGDGESMRDVVVQAVKARVNLAGANLGRVNLAGAYLAGADLGGAYLGGADLARANLGGAYLAGADLGGAYLGGADLGGADLGGADLADADLARAKINNGHVLVGKRPVLQIGPIGSRGDHLVAYLTDAGVMVRTGCFFGTLAEFRAACIETHGESVHGREYAAAITLIEAHAALWAPPEGAE